MSAADSLDELFVGVAFFKDWRRRRCGLVWKPQWGGLLHPLTIVYRQFWFYDFAPHALTTTHRENRLSLLTVLRARRIRRASARALALASSACVSTEEIP